MLLEMLIIVKINFVYHDYRKALWPRCSRKWAFIQILNIIPSGTQCPARQKLSVVCIPITSARFVTARLICNANCRYKCVSADPLISFLFPFFWLHYYVPNRHMDCTTHCRNIVRKVQNEIANEYILQSTNRNFAII